jgi:long-chain fatty acid transport protein
MRKLALLSALLCTPVLSLASGFEVINTNPRDLALSSSAVAAQQDAAAVYANPAALSRLEGLNLSLAGGILSLSTTWTAPAGDPYLSGSADTNFAPTTPVNLYAAYGTKIGARGLGFGLGMAVPGGGQMDWDEDWQGRGRIIVVQRRMLGFYANAGVEVFPWLRLGGGAIYYYGMQYLKIGIQPYPDAYGELDTAGGGFSFQLAAEVKPLENLTFGIDYKHKAVMSMDGNAHLQMPPKLQGPTTQDQGAKEDLPFPNQLAIAAAYRVSKPVLLMLQFNYARFQVYTSDLIIGDSGLTFDIPRNYDDGYTIRAGVEWDQSDRLALRAGLMRDISGLSTDTLSPTLPDSNTWGFSAGAAYAFKPGLSLNAAVFYGLRDKQTATGTEAFPGSYNTDVWIATLGVVWATGVGASH